MKTLKDPKDRLARWILFLENYSYEIKHRSGKQNANADAISRIPYEHEEDSEVNEIEINDNKNKCQKSLQTLEVWSEASKELLNINSYPSYNNESPNIKTNIKQEQKDNPNKISIRQIVTNGLNAFILLILQLCTTLGTLVQPSKSCDVNSVTESSKEKVNIEVTFEYGDSVSISLLNDVQQLPDDDM